MFASVKVFVVFLIVILSACNNQAHSLTTEDIATVTPFTLPPTWTPKPSLVPQTTSSVISDPTHIQTTTMTVVPSTSTSISSITISPSPDIDDIGLWKLLSQYGQPSNVLINTTDASPIGKMPFSLVVYYDKPGIVALYYDWALIRNEKIYFCLKSVPPVSTDFQISTTNDNSKFLDFFITTIDYWINDIGLLPLQDASDLSVEQFYLAFRDPKSNSCIVTTSDTWKLKNEIPTYPTSTPALVYPWVETAISTP